MKGTSCCSIESMRVALAILLGNRVIGLNMIDSVVGQVIRTGIFLIVHGGTVCFGRTSTLLILIPLIRRWILFRCCMVRADVCKACKSSNELSIELSLGI